MINFNEKVHSVMEYVRDSRNPVISLVHKAVDVKGASIPFYQVEEVREASFQSEYACEMIIKALSLRLDESNAVTVNKALCLLRVLFLEGAVGIRVGAASLRFRLCNISNQQDVRAGSVEDSNKALAFALLAALDGHSDSLATFSSSYVSGVKDAVAPVLTTCKSEFQLMQEKERRMYRRQCEEERRQNAVIVPNKPHDTFTASADPAQLVEQILTNPKKKIPPPELNAFVAAAAATGRVPDVCAALERRLCGRESLQNRYKLLLVAEALVGGAAEALEWLRANNAGVRRHLDAGAAENPVKAEAARETAKRIMQRLREGHAGEMGERKETGNAPPTQQQQQQQQQQRQQQQQLWGIADSTAPALVGLDDLFAGVTLKSESASAPQPSHIFGSAAQPATVSSSGDMPKQRYQSLNNTESAGRRITPLTPVPRPLESPPPLREQMKNAQHNMQTIVSMMAEQPHQQQQQQQQQQQESLWGTSGNMPTSVAPGAPSGLSDCALRPLPEQVPAPFDVFASQSEDTHSNDESGPVDNEKLRLMEQLRVQIEGTRRMLEQQQAAFLTLQAEMMNE